MCGRYSLTTPVEGLRALFGFVEQPNLAPRYNIAPTQDVVAVRLAPPRGSGEEDTPAPEAPETARHLVLLRWGLIPPWAKDPSIASRLINARAETVAEKPAFRAAFKARRCLIAADGFYEWQKRGTGPKQPYRITLAGGGPFAFAGLWERWRDPESGAPVESGTIITTEATPALAAIHPRMPVILPPAAFAAWLDPAAGRAALQDLLRPFTDAPLVATAVSTRVNKVANDDAAVIRPLAAAGSEAPRLI